MNMRKLTLGQKIWYVIWCIGYYVIPVITLLLAFDSIRIFNHLGLLSASSISLIGFSFWQFIWKEKLGVVKIKK